MKGFLQHRSKRWGHDGWAIFFADSPTLPLHWSVSTTREEARELLKEKRTQGTLLDDRYFVGKVLVRVEAVQ